MPISGVSTWLRPASSRSRASASISEMASGRSRGPSWRMLGGTTRSTSSSSELSPSSSSIAACSAGSGPMWRVGNSSWASSSLSEVGGVGGVGIGISRPWVVGVGELHPRCHGT